MAERLSKSDLIGRVARRHRLTKAEATGIVDTMLDAITEAVESGDTLAIHGFGIFEMRDRPARMGRNPKTGEAVAIPAKATMVFRAAKRPAGA